MVEVSVEEICLLPAMKMKFFGAKSKRKFRIEAISHYEAFRSVAPASDDNK